MYKFRANNREEGLTLVEILVAIALLAVVSVMVVAIINTTMNSATRFGNVSSTQTEVATASSTIQRDLSAAQKVTSASNNSVTMLLRQSNKDYEVTYFAYDPMKPLAVPPGVITAQLPDYKAVIELRKNVSDSSYGQRILVKGIDVKGFSEPSKHQMFTYYNAENDEITVPLFDNNTSTAALSTLNRIERVEFRIAANAEGRGTPIQIESSATVSGTGVTSGTSPETVDSIPACPTNIRVDFDDVNAPLDAVIEWYAPSGATSYTIYRTNVNSGVMEKSHVIPDPNTTLFVDNNETDWGRTYSWTIQANGAGGSSPQCGPIVGTVIPQVIQFVNQNSLASLTAVKANKNGESLARVAEPNLPAGETVATVNPTANARYTVARGLTNQLTWENIARTEGAYGATGFKVYDPANLETPVATITNAGTKNVQLPANYGDVRNYIVKAYNAGGESHTSRTIQLISPPLATPFTVVDPDTSVRSTTDARVNMPAITANTSGFRAAKYEGYAQNGSETCVTDMKPATQLNFINAPSVNSSWDTNAAWGTSGCYRLTPFNDAGPGVASTNFVDHKPGKFVFTSITNPTIMNFIDETRNRYGTAGAGQSLPYCWSNPSNGTVLGNCAGVVADPSHNRNAYGPMGMFGRINNSYNSINVVWGNSSGAYGGYNVTRNRIASSSSPDQNPTAKSTHPAPFVAGAQSLRFSNEMPGSVFEFTTRATANNGKYRDRTTQHLSRPDIPHSYSGTYYTQDFGTWKGDRIKANVYVSAIRGLATSVTFGSQMPGPNPGLKVETKNISNSYETFISEYQTIRGGANYRYVQTNLNRTIQIQPASISAGQDVQRSSPVSVVSQQVGRAGQINIIDCDNCTGREQPWIEEGYPYWVTGMSSRYWSGGYPQSGTVTPGNNNGVDAPPLPDIAPSENTCARYVEDSTNFENDPTCEPGDGIPPAPVLSSTQTGTTTHNVTWSGWNALAAYDVTTIVNGGNPVTVTKGPSERSITVNVPVGQTAEVKVIARNTFASSAEGKITLTSTPGVPVGLNATVTDNDIYVTWTAVSGATSYEISYTTGGVTKTATSTANSTTLSNLAPGSYAIRVKAKAGQSESGLSAVITRAILTAPTNVQATVSGTSITVSWSPVSGATGYQVVRNGVVVNSTTSPLVLTGMTAGTHNIQVRALATGSTGPLSSEVNATIGINTPANFNATVTGQTMALSWSAVTGASSYDVRYRVGTGAWTSKEVTGTSTSLTGLPHNVYTVEVASKGGTVTSPYASLSRAVLATPGAPTVTQASATVMKVDWTKVANATNYDIGYKLGSGAIQTVNVGNVATTNISYTAAGTYTFYVRAINGGTTTDWSAAKTMVIAAAPTSAKAVITTASDGKETANVTWAYGTAVSGTSFEVTYRPSSSSTGTTATASGSARSLSLTGLSLTTGNWVFEVRTIINGVESLPSTTTVNVLAQPTVSTIDVLDNGEEIIPKWNAITGRTSYEYELTGPYSKSGSTTNTEISFDSQLKPGTYTFKVRALGTDYTGNWATGTVTLTPSYDKGDLLIMDANKELWNYGASASNISGRVSIGKFAGTVAFHTSDLNSDGTQDVLIQQTDGKLIGYYGYPNGGFSQVALGSSGWNNVELNVGFHASTDTYPSVFLKDPSTGNLWEYPNTNGKDLGTRNLIGSGWGPLVTQVVDLDGNKAVEWIAQNSAGQLLLYRTTASGLFLSETRPVIGSGWNSYKMSTVDDYLGNGNHGMLAQLGSTMYYYPFVSSAGVTGARITIAGSWGTGNLFPSMK